MDKLPAKIKTLLAELAEDGGKELESEVLRQMNASIKRHSVKYRREAEFSRRLNREMMAGLQNIYREIAKLTEPAADAVQTQPDDSESASKIFREASRQLEEIMNSTLSAADKIMDSSETIQANQLKVEGKLSPLLAQASGTIRASLQELHDLLDENRDLVTSIVMALSFQDLTGQRIKKVVQALGSIHGIVVQTYLSAGLMLKKSEQGGEDLDFDALKNESRREAEAQVNGEAAGTELLGPDGKADQGDVDDLLAQLGL